MRFLLQSLRHLACLALLGASTLVTAAPTYDTLRLAGPGAVVSFPLMHMAESGALRAYATTVEFRPWSSPDQLRVLLANDQIDFSAAPINLPALLANRGQPVKLLNVSVWGILWLVSRSPTLKGYADLNGQELLVPFQRDLPALLLDEVLQANGLQAGENITLRRTRDAQDAIALMLADQGQHALLGEPTASLLLWRNAQAGGAPLYRVQSLEQSWRAAFPEQPELPQAGVMASARMARDPALLRAVSDAYAASTRWCVAQPADCAAMVVRHMPHLPVAAVEESIRVTRLESRPAQQARPQVEALYTLLGKAHPQAIGGRLPDADFYLP